MYRKVLVPLDGSRESEQVLNSIHGLLDPESEVVLLKVIPPMTGQTIGQITLTGSQREEAERGKVLDYLRGIVQQQEGAPGHWRCEAVVSRSVAEGITNYAIQEGVDLIAMYTHDRKGLARLIRGSIAAQVQRNSPIEVRVFRPRELAATTS
jgi:nucleotide-binding universal stress UspA family protein